MGGGCTPPTHHDAYAHTHTHTHTHAMLAVRVMTASFRPTEHGDVHEGREVHSRPGQGQAEEEQGKES